MARSFWRLNRRRLPHRPGGCTRRILQAQPGLFGWCRANIQARHRSDLVGVSFTSAANLHRVSEPPPPEEQRAECNSPFGVCIESADLLRPPVRWIDLLLGFSVGIDETILCTGLQKVSFWQFGAQRIAVADVTFDPSPFWETCPSCFQSVCQTKCKMQDARCKMQYTTHNTGYGSRVQLTRSSQSALGPIGCIQPQCCLGEAAV